MLSGQRIVCVSQLSALLAPARNAEYHLGLWTKLSPLQLSSPTGARAPEGQGYHTVLFPLRLVHGQRSLCSSKGMSHFSHDLGKSLLGQVRVPQEGFQGTGWVRPQVLQGDKLLRSEVSLGHSCLFPILVPQELEPPCALFSTSNGCVQENVPSAFSLK